MAYGTRQVIEINDENKEWFEQTYGHTKLSFWWLINALLSEFRLAHETHPDTSIIVKVSGSELKRKLDDGFGRDYV
jgi:hypothetical protein